MSLIERGFSIVSIIGGSTVLAKDWRRLCVLTLHDFDSDFYWLNLVFAGNHCVVDGPVRPRPYLLIQSETVKWDFEVILFIFCWV